MKEEYLHYLWQLKRLPFNKMKLVDGRPITIKNTGWLNYDAGPDFFNGKIEIDGLDWSGNIEFHVKSSDWFTHGHQHDDKYNNVILHVVYKHDRDVFIDEKPIPTLQLKEFIDYKHLDRFNQLLKTHQRIPCATSFPSENINVEHQITIALFQRMQRKAQRLEQVLGRDKENRKKALLISVIQSFGGRANKLSFLELANILPIDIIAKESWNQTRIESIIFGCSGMLNDSCEDLYYEQLQNEWTLLKSKHQLQEMSCASWSFGGVRPSSFPTMRLAQLSAFLSSWDIAIDINDSATLILEKFLNHFNNPPNEYWRTHVRFNKTSKSHQSIMSKKAQSLVVINGLVSYLIYVNQLTDRYDLIDKAQNILESLPPEQNYIVKAWRKLGVKPKNAGESQGLIELKNEFCNFRRCLSCKIGHVVMDY